jgi:hypothetical protein
MRQRVALFGEISGLPVPLDADGLKIIEEAREIGDHSKGQLGRAQCSVNTTLNCYYSPSGTSNRH